MSLTPIQYPTSVYPANNYMFVVADPSNAYSAITDYYVQFEVFNADTNTSLIKNNVKVYPNVYNGYAVFDIHKVLNNTVSNDIKPILGSLGFYSSQYGFTKYNVNAYEFSGATPLTTYLNFCSGYTFDGVVDRNTTWNQNAFVTTTPGARFLTNWTYPYYVRVNDRHALSFWNSFTQQYKMVLNVNKPDGSTVLAWTLTSPVSGGTTLDHLQYFGSGYYEVDHTLWTGATLYSGILTSNSAVSYTLQLYSVNHSLPWNPVSEIAEYIVDNDCTLIENMELMWQNEMGGYDFYTFYRERHKSWKTEKTTYDKIDYSYSNGQIVTQEYSAGETILTNKVTTHYKVRSKVLDNDMSVNLAGIFLSKNVYWLHKLTTSDTVEYNPIIIDDESYEVMNNYNRPNRAIYEFTFRLSNEKNTIQ